MAEFSKESNFDWSDFSIKKEFDKLEKGYYIGMVCEHFGFIAIANSNGICQVAMPTEAKEGEAVEPGSMPFYWHEFCFKTNKILPLKDLPE